MITGLKKCLLKKIVDLNEFYNLQRKFPLDKNIFAHVTKSSLFQIFLYYYEPLIPVVFLVETSLSFFLVFSCSLLFLSSYLSFDLIWLSLQAICLSLTLPNFETPWNKSAWLHECHTNIVLKSWYPISIFANIVMFRNLAVFSMIAMDHSASDFAELRPSMLSLSFSVTFLNCLNFQILFLDFT